VKQLIKDYIQMNADTVANSLNQQGGDPYQNSKATLIADIHRVRRYFYHAIQKIHLVTYLSRKAVTLAIEEVKKTYDDDGNILINIQNYLNTFCLENRFEDQASYAKKKADWQLELDQLIEAELFNDKEINKLKIEVQQAEEKLKLSETRKETIFHPTNEELMNKQVNSKLNEKTANDTERQRNVQAANSIRAEYQQKKVKAEEDVHKDLNEYKQKREQYRNSVAQVPSETAQIEHLRDLIKMNFEESEKKLKVKYGRGLLLYGPPGTGM
jgi:flagellar biosynthesis GTPase FlhF